MVGKKIIQVGCHDRRLFAQYPTTHILYSNYYLLYTPVMVRYNFMSCSSLSWSVPRGRCINILLYMRIGSTKGFDRLEENYRTISSLIDRYAGIFSLKCSYLTTLGNCFIPNFIYRRFRIKNIIILDILIPRLKYSIIIFFERIIK